MLLIGCSDDKADTAVTPTPIMPTAVAQKAAVNTPTQTATPSATATAKPTNTTTPTPTNTPSPTPTLTPDERFIAAEQLVFNGQYADALVQLAQLDDTAATQRLRGIAHFQNGDIADAQAIFTQWSQTEGFGSEAYYWLGRVYQAQGDCQNATASDNIYLLRNPDLSAYVKPLSADCYAKQGGSIEAQIISLEEAIKADAHQRKTFFTRVRLANLYMNLGEYDRAAALYRQSRFIAQTDYSKAEMGYLEGYANKRGGNNEAAYQQMAEVVRQYPEQNGSYQALLQLVQADVEVDPYQRGVIDYYAAAYTPCVDVLTAYVETTAAPAAEAYRYIAQCYAGADNVPAALTWFERYSETTAENAVAGQMGAADLLASTGQITQAIAVYDNIVETRPIDPQAPDALWAATRLIDFELEDADAAIGRYITLANQYFWHERAAQALFRAGWLAKTERRTIRANEIWRDAVRKYSDSAYGRASLVQLLAQTPDDPELLQLANGLDTLPVYYSTRIRELADGTAPFSPMPFAWDKSFDQEAAEAWLMIQAPAPVQPIDQLPDEILGDAAFGRAEKLLGLYQWREARDQFEELRLLHAEDILVNYQFALYYREIGLYGSSVRAAVDLLNLTNSTSYAAPPFIGSLAWPTYYGELVTEAAAQYDLDPLLMFALLRQESLFESFAASSVAAQGLAQVMPATGKDIAAALDWDNYETADLLRPAVAIPFGSYYLDQQLAIFDGNIHAALAGYNAGAGNAIRWYEAAGDDLDAFIEVVNFPESRSYVERIYAGHAVYRHLYGMPVDSLP